MQMTKLSLKVPLFHSESGCLSYIRRFSLLSTHVTEAMSFIKVVNCTCALFIKSNVGIGFKTGDDSVKSWRSMKHKHNGVDVPTVSL